MTTQTGESTMRDQDGAGGNRVAGKRLRELLLEEQSRSSSLLVGPRTHTAPVELRTDARTRSKLLGVPCEEGAHK